jgi:hypothetical protein
LNEGHHLQFAPGDLLDEALGHLHRPDQIGRENPRPECVVRLAEWMMRTSDSGVVQQNVDRLFRKLVRQRVDGRVVRHIEFHHFDVAPDPAGLPRSAWIQTRCDHAVSINRVVPREFNSEPGITAGNQYRCHLSNTP